MHSPSNDHSGDGNSAGVSVTTSERIGVLSERAHDEAAAFEPPVHPPDEDAAMRYLLDGVGPAIGVYIDARTGELYRFTESEYRQLETALNTWFRLYAACYGVETTPAVTLRTAAAALIDTHDLTAVARTLTGVGPGEADEPL